MEVRGNTGQEMEARGNTGQEMSLAALRQTDPYISSIVDVTGQVALYSFSAKANGWEKTDIEGTLFVYTRSASPRHGFTIMNRLNMHNLVEPVNKDLEFQLHEPFLLYRNASLSIYSIWFYDTNDCQRIAKLMPRVVQQECERAQHRGSPSATNGCNAGRPIDILEMLSKAKNEYEKGQVVNDHNTMASAGVQKNTHLTKVERLEISEHSGSTRQPQDKCFPAGKKHFTVEELFGTSLPKEQQASTCPNPDIIEKRQPDIGHNLFLPFSCEQSKPLHPVVKAESTTVNSSTSDFSQPVCITPVLIAQGTVAQPDSRNVPNYSVRLSPVHGSTLSSEVLPTPILPISSNATGIMHVIQTAVRQTSPHMSQPILDLNHTPQNWQFLPPLATIITGNVSSTSHSSVDLLQKLKLTPQHDQLQSPPISKATIASKFSSAVSQLATPESFKGNPIKTKPIGSLLMTPIQNVHEKREPEPFAQHKSLSKAGPGATSQYVASTTTVAPTVLLSPSVFQQSFQKPTDQEDKMATSPPTHGTADVPKSNAPLFVLSRSQLQETLVHLIKNDSSFLNTVHEVYLHVLTKNLDNVQL
ncbi:hypothetical protein FKM82_004297 [Ascaphus truei]